MHQDGGDPMQQRDGIFATEPLTAHSVVSTETGRQWAYGERIQTNKK